MFRALVCPCSITSFLPPWHHGRGKRYQTLHVLCATKNCVGRVTQLTVGLHGILLLSCSLIGCAIVMKHYAEVNISRKSQTTIKYSLKLLRWAILAVLLQRVTYSGRQHYLHHTGHAETMSTCKSHTHIQFGEWVNHFLVLGGFPLWYCGAELGHWSCPLDTCLCTDLQTNW